MVFASLNNVMVPKLFTSSKNGRTTTVYVPAFTLELIKGPRTRINFLSDAVVETDMNGLTVTVGGLVVKSTLFDAERSMPKARRSALLVAKVGSSVNWLLVSKFTVTATVVGTAPEGSTIFAFTGAPLTITEICALV